MEENNKIIADFLGGRIKSPSNLYIFNKWRNDERFDWIDTYNQSELKFHSDWNWLMEVVEKIENTKIKDYGILTNITNDKTYISVYHYGEGGKWSILISNFNEEYKDFNKIQRTYKAVIEFINFYNNQKEE